MRAGGPVPTALTGCHHSGPAGTSGGADHAWSPEHPSARRSHMPARSPDRGAQPLRIDPEVPDLLAIYQHPRSQVTVELCVSVVGLRVDFFTSRSLRPW